MLETSRWMAIDGRVPGKAYRSVLNPHRAEIFLLRRDELSYAEIAAVLLEKYGVKTTPGAIHSFMKSRIKNPAGTLGFKVSNFEMAAGLKSPTEGTNEGEQQVKAESAVQEKVKPATKSEEPLRKSTETNTVERPKKVIYQPVVHERKPNPFTAEKMRLNHQVEDDDK